MRKIKAKKIVSLLDEFNENLSMNAMPNNQMFSGTIFHYTSLENIASILFNDDNTVILWASRFDCLNDVSEGEIIGRIYQSACKNLLDKNLITNHTYNLFSTITPSCNESFLVPNNTTGKGKHERLEHDIYIVSFSKSYDSLSMWNYYSKGKIYEGINIGFSSDKLKDSILKHLPEGKAKCEICSVVYGQDEQEKMIEDFLLEINENIAYAKDESSIRATISLKIASWKMLFKDSHFKHEEEIRVILKIPKKYKNEFNIKYRNYAGLIIPYIPIKANNLTVSQVTIGPIIGDEIHKQLQKNILHEMLVDNNYSIREELSSVPIRY